MGVKGSSGAGGRGRGARYRHLYQRKEEEASMAITVAIREVFGTEHILYIGGRGKKEEDKNNEDDHGVNGEHEDTKNTKESENHNMRSPDFTKMVKAIH